MPECVCFWQVLERKGKDLFRDICCLFIVTYNEGNIFHTLITHNILYGFILSPILVLFGLEGFFLHPNKLMAGLSDITHSIAEIT